MEQDFHGDLQVNLSCFFAFFSGVLTELRGRSGANGLNQEGRAESSDKLYCILVYVIVS